MSADAGWWGPVAKSPSGFQYTGQNTDNMNRPVVVHAQAFIAVTDVTIDAVRLAMLNPNFSGMCGHNSAMWKWPLGLMSNCDGACGLPLLPVFSFSERSQ